MEYGEGSDKNLETLSDLNGKNSNERSFWKYIKENNWKEDQEKFLLPICLHTVGGA